MNIEKVNPNIKYIYHYTLKKNVKKILAEQEITSKDQYVFFTKSLKDSIIAFEREMMQENKLYIDVNGNLRKRKKCDKSDYCILKIPYKNDNQFFKFSFENQSKESIYTISISHKGSYQFKEAKVLEFPENRKTNILTKTAVAAIATGIILFPYNNIYAASWLEPNNYDTSWYTSESIIEYKINTAKEMAGLAYLVNDRNITFEGKRIEVKGNIDLTSNTWQTIKDIFRGSICGSHRIILNCFDGKLIENKDINTVEYLYNVLVDDNSLNKISVKSPYTVGKMKEAIGTNKTVFFNNEKLQDDKSLLDLNLSENDKIQVFSKYNYIEDINGVKIPFALESGDSIDNVKEKYSKKTNIPQNKIIIKYNGRVLNEGRTLADYNIQKYETLSAYIKVDINTSVEEGKGSIKSSQDTAISGEEITITLNPESEYEIDKVIVNGADKTNEVQNNELKIICNTKDINVKVRYKLKAKVSEEPKEQIKVNIENKESINNPETGDNIIIYIVTFITSFLGICIGKFKKNKH